MKKLALILCFSCIGCTQANRLLGHSEKQDIPITKVITATPDLPNTAPNFNVPITQGKQRVTYYGELPLNGKVPITHQPGAVYYVFIEERAINQWFIISDSYSDAFYYTLESGVIVYQGHHLENKAYCIYQDF